MRHIATSIFPSSLPCEKCTLFRGHQLLTQPPPYTSNNSGAGASHSLLHIDSPTTTTTQPFEQGTFIGAKSRSCVLRTVHESFSLADDALHESCPLPALVTLFRRVATAHPPDGYLVDLLQRHGSTQCHL